MPVTPKKWFWCPIIILLMGIGTIWLFRQNVVLFLKINHLNYLTGKFFWPQFTILGDGLFIAVLLFPLCRRYPNLVWGILLALLFSTIIVQGMKHWLNLPRPPKILPLNTFVLIGPRHNMRSFPSGHSSAIAVLMGVSIFHQKENWLRTLLLVLALLIAVSRIGVGVHWPVDVLAGFSIGWLSAIIGYRLTYQKKWVKNYTVMLITGSLLLIASVFFLTHYETGYTEALWLKNNLGEICFILGSIELILLLFWGPVSEKRPKQLQTTV
ncbi:phosphatase PAP2 family protein [bacterium]|nr:phosphatase PAP2 family protein [bacterium]